MRDSEVALALVLSAVLEVRDLLKATNKPSAWTVPEDLKGVCYLVIVDNID